MPIPSTASRTDSARTNRSACWPVRDHRKSCTSRLSWDSTSRTTTTLISCRRELSFRKCSSTESPNRSMRSTLLSCTPTTTEATSPCSVATLCLARRLRSASATMM
uniref:(northern house mosquito) hypothetical protein n=1 Tax=Culex pipiens TaxID=7175 RepID=A0A8D8FZT9_CULPI